MRSVYSDQEEKYPGPRPDDWNKLSEKEKSSRWEEAKNGGDPCLLLPASLAEACKEIKKLRGAS